MKSNPKYGVDWGFVCKDCSKFKKGEMVDEIDYQGYACKFYRTAKFCTHCKKDTESHDMGEIAYEQELHDEYWSSVM